jgi:thiosulfate/3-mercaptopyruvate sulfurtransferase
MKFAVILLMFVSLFSFANQAASQDSQPLVDVQWLKSMICTPGIIILDVRRSAEDYKSGHIPCALHTNYYKDGWRMRKQGVPHMMPPVPQLEVLAGKLGIKVDSHVVIYGSGTGEFDAAETTSIYLTLKYLGHTKISILDGGLPAWMDEWSADFDVGIVAPDPTQYTANPKPGLLLSIKDVETALGGGSALVDIRSNDMFLGINKAWMLKRPGTIPGALNLPMSWFTVDSSLKFRDRQDLQILFSAANVPLEGRVVLFCNAGLESSMGWFVAHELLGNKQAVLYDGSLAEWTKNQDLPMTRHVELN